MKTATKEAWQVFWNACKETPRGMLTPFIEGWRLLKRCASSIRHEHEPSKHA
jgi:hypothetical protein